MTTFPQDLHISFDKGVNVIFGGNYSGKTTIINSLRFGVFGLSWGHTIEGIERRYFSSRIREIQRKSLDINTVYRIDPMSVDVRRTIFSSGTAEIEAHVSKGSTRPLSALVNSIKLEKQYYSILRDCMGQITEEQLRFIPNLIFAEENRQSILWTKNLEDFILSLLISPNNAKQLRRIDSQFIKTKDELKKFQQDRERLTRRISEKEGIHEFLQKSLKEVEGTKIDKIIRQYNDINIEIQRLRIRLLQTNTDLQNKLKGKSELFLRMNTSQEAIRNLELKLQQTKERFLKVILNPKNPEESHVSRYLYYEKQCPFCFADLSNEISNRIESKMCLLCGKGPSIEYKEDVAEIEQEISGLDEKKKKLAKSCSEIQSDIDKINEEIEKFTKSREEENLRESALSEKMNELKGIEEQVHKREVISRELKEIRGEVSRNKKLIVESEKNIGKIEAEIDELSKVYKKAKMAMKTEIDSSVRKIKGNFSLFVSLATNNEASGSLSANFVPVLNGRQIFHPEFASQFERTLMDYAFRIALLSVLAEKTKSYPSLVIETPDEVTDESYIPHLAKAILNFSSNLSIVITTVSTDMMKHLLINYKPNDRRKRLANLVSKGTLTQRRFYQTPLKDYLSVDL